MKREAGIDNNTGEAAAVEDPERDDENDEQRMSTSLPDFQLSKDSVVDYMMKFDLLMTKVKKLDPILNFKVPLFKVTQDLKVVTHPIPSPFSEFSTLGCVERIVGKLQPYLYSDEKMNFGLGLVGINTAERTIVGKFRAIPRA